MKKVAIIVAGGAGQRMGSDIPKQFLTILGKPIFLYSIEAFIKAFFDIHIVLVLPVKYHDYTKEILMNHGFSDKKIKIVSGGETRFHSVKNGLAVLGDDSIVFIHDAVRCLVSVDLIQRCCTSCMENGSAIPVIPVRDSIRRVNDDKSSEIMPREQLRIVQTPQTFRSKLITEAFKTSYQPSFTDEASVLEANGLTVNLIDGEESNIKITYPEDLDFAEWKISRFAL